MSAPAPLPIDYEPLRTVDRDMVGSQWVYRFPNGYGASVIQGPYTYGGPEGFYEVGVIVFSGDQWGLTYDTPVTNDVLGWLDLAAVTKILADIAALPGATS